MLLVPALFDSSLVFFSRDSRVFSFCLELPDRIAHGVELFSSREGSSTKTSVASMILRVVVGFGALRLRRSNVSTI